MPPAPVRGGRAGRSPRGRSRGSPRSPRRSCPSGGSPPARARACGRRRARRCLHRRRPPARRRGRRRAPGSRGARCTRRRTRWPPRSREILARNAHPPVGLRADRVDDGVVELGEIVVRQVAADLDPAQEPEAGLGGDPLERLRDRLDLRVVGSDAEADEPPGRGQPLDHVHLDRQVGVEQVSGGVEARRAGADDGDAQGHASILRVAATRASVRAAGATAADRVGGRVVLDLE